ncbi:MAG: DNA-binding protein, partial [Longicatena sp.]
MEREELFIFADEIAKRLCISKAFAYKLMQQMNKELQKQGFITIHGRV